MQARSGEWTPAEIVADGLLTVKEAAAFLRLGRSTLYGLMDAGVLPYCRLGRARRIPRRAAVEFAKAGLQGSWAEEDRGR